MIKYGPTPADWSTDHFPLTLGMETLGPGECYNCGMASHRSDGYSSTDNPIPKLEANWQSCINRLLCPHCNHFIELSGTLPVFIIDMDRVEIDPGMYNTSELEFVEHEEQENRQGS